MTPHRWKLLKFLGKLWCQRCGLLRLNNEATRRAEKKGCCE